MQYLTCKIFSDHISSRYIRSLTVSSQILVEYYLTNHSRFFYRTSECCEVIKPVNNVETPIKSIFGDFLWDQLSIPFIGMLVDIWSYIMSSMKLVIPLHLISWKKRLQTMLWHHNARVNSHQRWKQTRNRVWFRLWCELILALWCNSIVWSLFFHER